VAGQTYDVAPNGSDSATGTQAARWASIARAQADAQAGDTVYLRCGTYATGGWIHLKGLQVTGVPQNSRQRELSAPSRAAVRPDDPQERT
jgi:hypothetical protein